LTTVRSLFLAAVLLTAAAPAFAQDDFKALPAGPGRDVTVRICSQCHSPELVAGQAMDANGWKDLVNQMANNGAQGTDAEFDTITKYLAASFPAGSTPSAPAGVAPPPKGTTPATAAPAK
jgi:mono/diheme cytochrome c family protein